MTKRFGFTLAEVLITLGIIGVVAAMTIPTLISNTNGAQFKTAYKKALSTLNQAALMNIAMEDYDFSSLVADTNTGVNDIDGTQAKTMAYILTKRLSSATNTTEGYTWPSKVTYYSEHTCTASDISAADAEGELCYGATAGDEVTLKDDITDFSDWAIYSFADGTAFAFNPAAANCSAKNDTCIGFIDVNGSTTPNSPTVCTSGEEGGTGEVTEDNAGPCQVESTGIKDIFPVYFYGQTVEPASDAARAVLFGR